MEMSGLGRSGFPLLSFVLSMRRRGLIHVYLDGLEEAIKTARLIGNCQRQRHNRASPLLQQTVTSSLARSWSSLPLGADGPLKLESRWTVEINCVVAWGTTAADATVNTAVRDGFT